MTYTKQELKWFAERYWQEGGYYYSDNAKELFAQYIDGLDEIMNYSEYYFNSKSIDNMITEIFNDPKTYSVPKGLDDIEERDLKDEIYDLFALLKHFMKVEHIGLFTPINLQDSARGKAEREKVRRSRGLI